MSAPSGSEKRSFLIYRDHAPLVAGCSDAEAGKLFKALFLYADSGQIADLENPMLNGILKTFIRTIEADSAKYAERCKKNAENARARFAKNRWKDPVKQKVNQFLNFGQNEYAWDELEQKLTASTIQKTQNDSILETDQDCVSDVAD